MDMDQQQYYYYYCMCYMMWRHRALAVLILMVAIWWRDSDGRRSRGRGAKYGPLVDRDISRTNTLARLIDASDATCIKQLRMSRPVFHKLCSRLKERGLLVDTFHVSVEEQVAIFLYMVGQHHTNASVGFSFWRSGETVSRYFNAVLQAMGQLARDLIYVKSTDTHTKITSSPNRFYPYFEKTAINYLTRPIRFYNLLEELFIDQSQADGSLAADQTTVNVPDDSDDNDGIKEIEGYNFTADTDEDVDSDNIDRHSPKTDLDGKPSSKKRRCEKSNSKKSAKSKVSTTDVAASIVMLAGSLSKPPPPPPIPVQPVVPADPYANLWKRINDLTITSKDRLVIVAHLSKPDQDVLRSYLNCSPDSMLHEWVISFFEQVGGSSTAF